MAESALSVAVSQRGESRLPNSIYTFTAERESEIKYRPVRIRPTNLSRALSNRLARVCTLLAMVEWSNVVASADSSTPLDGH